jgi:hypothetical protein
MFGCAEKNKINVFLLLQLQETSLIYFFSLFSNETKHISVSYIQSVKDSKKLFFQVKANEKNKIIIQKYT